MRRPAKRSTRTPLARGLPFEIALPAFGGTPPLPRCRVCAAVVTAQVFLWPSGVVRGIGIMCSADLTHAQ